MNPGFPHPVLDARVELEDGLHDDVHKGLLQVLVIISPLVHLLVLPFLEPLVFGEGQDGNGGFTCSGTKLGRLSLCPSAWCRFAATNPNLPMQTPMWPQVFVVLYTSSSCLGGHFPRATSSVALRRSSSFAASKRTKTQEF